MITPRHFNLARNAIRKQGLIEQDFEITSDRDELKIKYKKEDFYFLFAPYPATPIIPLITAGAFMQALSAFFRPYKIEYRPSILLPPADLGLINNSARDFDYALNTINRWLAWIKLQFGPFDELSQRREKTNSTPFNSSTMNGEEIAKKKAKDAVALRYNIHRELDKYSDAIIEKSARLEKPVDKSVYFQEAIRLINEEILSHRSTCKEGAGCYTEKQYEQIIFYLQQELDKIDLSVMNIIPAQASALSNSTTEVEKIFISHSSKDIGIVEEIIDLLEIIGVKHEQIFCSSLEGYGIELGQDFLQRIKNELNGNVLVLFVITSNFYSSPVSLCEMGAAWVKTSKHIPIVVPPLGYEDVKGVIPLTQGFKIDEPMKWNQLKEQVEKWLHIDDRVNSSVWERKRDKVMRVIATKIQPIVTLPQQAKVRNLKQKDSNL